MARTSDYAELLRRGRQYEEFVYSLIKRRYGVEIRPCLTYEEQLTVGENYSGIEVKCQERCREYGSLVIECAETRSNGEWVASGIWRGDNSRYLATGDWHTVWMFDIPTLQRNVPTLKRYDKPTSRGHILPIPMADRLCRVRLEVP